MVYKQNVVFNDIDNRAQSKIGRKKAVGTLCNITLFFQSLNLLERMNSKVAKKLQLLLLDWTNRRWKNWWLSAFYFLILKCWLDLESPWSKSANLRHTKKERPILLTIYWGSRNPQSRPWTYQMFITFLVDVPKQVLFFHWKKSNSFVEMPEIFTLSSVKDVFK